MESGNNMESLRALTCLSLPVVIANDMEENGKNKRPTGNQSTPIFFFYTAFSPFILTFNNYFVLLGGGKKKKVRLRPCLPRSKWNPLNRNLQCNVLS